MVLMRVAFVMGEDEVGPHPHPEVVEELLQLGEVREVSFPKGQHLDLGLRGTGEESLGTGAPSGRIRITSRIPESVWRPRKNDRRRSTECCRKFFNARRVNARNSRSECDSSQST
jgi:hypothetical protein